MDENTYVVINGDIAPWIYAGIDYFHNAIYTYDRYHLTKWMNQVLSNRTKKERDRAHQAAKKNNPVALLVAIAEAEKAEVDKNKKAETSALRQFILEHQDVFRDYRELLKEKGVATTGMRMMGSAESNMDIFAKH